MLPVWFVECHGEMFRFYDVCRDNSWYDVIWKEVEKWRIYFQKIIIKEQDLQECASGNLSFF